MSRWMRQGSGQESSEDQDRCGPLRKKGKADHWESRRGMEGLRWGGEMIAGSYLGTSLSSRRSGKGKRVVGRQDMGPAASRGGICIYISADSCAA